MPEKLSIGELAKIAGVSTHTLRYYEDQGLMPLVERTSSGNHRTYISKHVGWIGFLRRLRDADMPIAELREYVALIQRGEDETSPERVAILARHRQRLLDRIEELRSLVDVLDRKIRLGCGPQREMEALAGSSRE